MKLLFGNLGLTALIIACYASTLAMTNKIYAILVSIFLVPIILGMIVISISNLVKAFKHCEDKVIKIFNIILVLSNLVFTAFAIYKYITTFQGVM